MMKLLHNLTIHNATQVTPEGSRIACIGCKRIYVSPGEEAFTCVDMSQDTALCLHCGIDSVLSLDMAEKLGFIVTEELLENMNQFWFTPRAQTGTIH